jgi:RimJ/RimL family protein N-acetyltransferase
LIRRSADLVRSRTVFHWGVARRTDDGVIGHATLFEIEEASRRAEIGYSIRRADWGRGLGTDAVRTLLGFAFERCGFRRIEADVEPRNLASLRVLQKLGFVREGYLRERWCIGEEIQGRGRAGSAAARVCVVLHQRRHPRAAANAASAQSSNAA